MVEVVAIDTNVLVRLIAKDDANQFEQASRLFSNSTIWLSNTVLVETEWVLRRGMGFSLHELTKTFEILCDLDEVEFEDYETFEQSIAAMRKGMDFADAMHMFRANKNDLPFRTFDKSLVKKASLIGANAELV